MVSARRCTRAGERQQTGELLDFAVNISLTLKSVHAYSAPVKKQYLIKQIKQQTTGNRQVKFELIN